MAIAALAVIILVLKFSIETFGVMRMSWTLAYITYYVGFFIIGVGLFEVAVTLAALALILTATLMLALAVGVRRELVFLVVCLVVVCCEVIARDVQI